MPVGVGTRRDESDPPYPPPTQIGEIIYCAVALVVHLLLVLGIPKLPVVLPFRIIIIIIYILSNHLVKCGATSVKIKHRVVVVVVLKCSGRWERCYSCVYLYHVLCTLLDLKKENYHQRVEILRTAVHLAMYVSEGQTA